MQNPQGRTAVKCRMLEKTGAPQSQQDNLLNDLTQSPNRVIKALCFVFG